MTEVQAVQLDLTTGTISGFADPRRRGMLFAATAEIPKWGRYAPLFGTDMYIAAKAPEGTDTSHWNLPATGR